MKVFKTYQPAKIAKYVKTYFSGQVFISGLGRFEFHQGKLILPEAASREYLRVRSEVNKEIKSLRNMMAAA